MDGGMTGTTGMEWMDGWPRSPGLGVLDRPKAAIRRYPRCLLQRASIQAHPLGRHHHNNIHGMPSRRHPSDLRYWSVNHDRESEKETFQPSVFRFHPPTHAPPSIQQPIWQFPSTKQPPQATVAQFVFYNPHADCPRRPA